MPFFHDQTNLEWPEDGSEPPPPRADEFMYMTAAEYRGEPTAGHSARFSIVPFSAADEPAPEPAVPVQVERRSLLDRLFGGGRSAAQPQQLRQQVEDGRRRQKLLQEQRTQQLFSVLVPALRSLGVRRAYCRYDGGNDEGFAWLDHYQTQAGEPIEAEVLVKRLHDMGIHEQLCAAGFRDHMRGVLPKQKMSDIKAFACGWLIDDWAWVLLGSSYGTGEYTMYGAFTVDLDECSVTDDSNARPIVQNIEIAS
jgi:hypothetical protein